MQQDKCVVDRAHSISLLPDALVVSALSRVSFHFIEELCHANAEIRYRFCGEACSNPPPEFRKPSTALFEMLLQRDFGISRRAPDCSAKTPMLREMVARSFALHFPNVTADNEVSAMAAKMRRIYKLLMQHIDVVATGEQLVIAMVDGIVAVALAPDSVAFAPLLSFLVREGGTPSEYKANLHLKREAMSEMWHIDPELERKKGGPVLLTDLTAFTTPVLAVDKFNDALDMREAKLSLSRDVMAFDVRSQSFLYVTEAAGELKLDSNMLALAAFLHQYIETTYDYKLEGNTRLPVLFGDMDLWGSRDMSDAASAATLIIGKQEDILIAFVRFVKDCEKAATRLSATALSVTPISAYTRHRTDVLVPADSLVTCDRDFFAFAKLDAHNDIAEPTQKRWSLDWKIGYRIVTQDEDADELLRVPIEYNEQMRGTGPFKSRALLMSTVVRTDVANGAFEAAVVSVLRLSAKPELCIHVVCVEMDQHKVLVEKARYAYTFDKATADIGRVFATGGEQSVALSFYSTLHALPVCTPIVIDFRCNELIIGERQRCGYRGSEVVRRSLRHVSESPKSVYLNLEQYAVLK